jgi:hypothetical protein
LDPKTRAIFHGSWAIQNREKTQEARYSVVLSQEAKQAKTHRPMALPFMASSNPTIVKIRDVP